MIDRLLSARRGSILRRPAGPWAWLLTCCLAASAIAPFAALGPAPLLAQEEPEEPVGTLEAPVGTLEATVDPEADRTLAAGLRQRLEEIDGAGEIRVEVAAGVVTLGGTVLRESDKEAVLGLVRRVEGVAQVEDQVEVEVDPAERLGPAVEDAFDRLRTLISYLPLLAISLVLIGLFVLLSRAVGRLDGLFARLSPNRFAQDLLRQAARTGVILIGVLIALEILDATALVGAVLGTAGVIGLALGFAFKDLVENYIASILLSIRQPFAPDDHVQIDSYEGKVMRLTSRATILMTLDGNHLRLPNSQVFKGVILNYTRNPRRRFGFGVGVGVEEDLSEAQALGIQAILDMPGTLRDPAPTALIEALGDSSVVIRFRGWVDQEQFDFAKVKSEAIRIVKTVLEEAGMDLPEPIYRVHLLDPSAVGATRVSIGAAPDADSAPAPAPDSGAGAEPPAARAAAEKAEKRSAKKKARRAGARRAADIGKDDHLERQMADERREADEQDDLLSSDAPIE